MKAGLTLTPGRKGTKRLTDNYGDRLVCVRYRYDEATGHRCTTVELIESEEPWFPAKRTVQVKIRYDEIPLLVEVMRGGMAAFVPADLKRITSILPPKQTGDTVLNAVIPSDTSDLDNAEVEKVTSIFAFMKSILEGYGIIRFQSERRLEFTTGDGSHH